MIRRLNKRTLTRGRSTLAKAPRVLTYQACTSWEAKGRGGAINGSCDNCGQFGHGWRYCPRLYEAGKAALAQRKGQETVA